MSWLPHWLKGLRADNRQSISPSGLDERPLDAARFVVVDLETTGLDVRRDRLLAVGAVAIEGGTILLGDQFEAIIHYPDLDPGDSVLIHELGTKTLESGHPARAVLEEFIAWADDAVMIAFHVAFDQRVLERSMKTHLGHKPGFAWLDAAELLPALFPERRSGEGRLDDWVNAFGLSVSARHNASADAFVTAELTMAALREARRQGIDTLKALHDRIKTWRSLRQIHH